jgi:hypothetical protein
MKIKELINFLKTLPEEFMDYSVVNGEEGLFEGELRYRIDKSVVAVLIDEETKELVLLHQYQEEEKNI